VNRLGNERKREGNPYKVKNTCRGAADGLKMRKKWKGSVREERAATGKMRFFQ
jgi:hypothetical protein